MRRAVVVASLSALAALAAACSPGPAATPGSLATQAVATPGGGTAGPGGTSGSGTGSGTGANYVAGAGKATVTIADVTQEFTGGTCKTASTGANTFEFTAGDLTKAPSIDIFVSSFSGPVTDGLHNGGTDLVSTIIGTGNYVLAGNITLKNGLTAGEFAGTTAGSRPVQISGSFTC